MGPGPLPFSSIQRLPRLESRVLSLCLLYVTILVRSCIRLFQPEVVAWLKEKSGGCGVSTSGSEARSNRSELNRAISFYTIRDVCKLSDARTESFLSTLTADINLCCSLLDFAAPVAEICGISVQRLRAVHADMRRRFAGLKCPDLICRLGGPGYPEQLAVGAKPPPFLFLRGREELLKERVVSVVGTRRPSSEGLADAAVIADFLGSSGFIVASGMAAGIDTAVHRAAMAFGHRTIAVLGTPLTNVYPTENAALQIELGSNQLLVTQFPPCEVTQPWHFPQRNATMSAISEATVVVEAGAMSGALIQADYSLEQRRPVFFPRRALARPDLVWPRKYIDKPGVYAYGQPEEILAVLNGDLQVRWESQQLPLF